MYTQIGQNAKKTITFNLQYRRQLQTDYLDNFTTETAVS